MVVAGERSRRSDDRGFLQMKTKRGNYDGASEFAYFDKDVQQMTENEMRSLLQFILHEAAPGEQDFDVVFEHLARAEEKAREQGVTIMTTEEKRPSTEEFIAYFKAAERLHVAACEFLNDWKKGDFELPKLAQYDAESLCAAATAYNAARDSVGVPE
jgi:hypothetical protein